MTLEVGPAEPDWGAQRRHGVSKQDNQARSQFRRDHDRVFYSAEFERLEDVTQIATMTSSMVRNRLTHSYRVEQIARSIMLANPDSGIDEDIVATAALVHDIGHAPFGHTGEEALQKAVTCDHHRTDSILTILVRQGDVKNLLAQKSASQVCKGPRSCLLPDGFEGNAQSFRILTLLASNHPPSTDLDENVSNGLNLTRRSLAASLKYPWLRGERSGKPNKWGVYDLDAPAFAWTFEADGGGYGTRAPVLEASVMDIADDIAYAVHDLEDAYKAGLIPFSEVSVSPLAPTFAKVIEYIRAEAEEGGESAPLYESPVGRIVEEFDRLDQGEDLSRLPRLRSLDTLLKLLPPSRYSGDFESRQRLSAWRSVLISSFVRDVTLEGGKARFKSSDVESNIEFLKQLTWYFVIDDPDLSAIREGQEELVMSCFDRLFHEAGAAFLVDSADDKSAWKPAAQHRAIKRLPGRLVDYIRLAQVQQVGNLQDGHPTSTPRQAVARAVVDYVCSLTDSEVYSYSLQITGAPTHSVPRAFVR